MENTFWQANFWGIVGTISGALGLIISYLTWKYSRPNIKITQLLLKMRKSDDNFIRSKKDTSPDQLSRYSVSLNLDIRLANKRGGPGAIEKPILVFRTKKKHFWDKIEEIEFEPQTKEYSHTRISDSAYETNVTNLGRSFNLSGGEIRDDELEYYISGSEGELQKVAKGYERSEFLIRFSNNFGKKHEVKVKLVLTKH